MPPVAATARISFAVVPRVVAHGAVPRGHRYRQRVPVAALRHDPLVVGRVVDDHPSPPEEPADLPMDRLPAGGTTNVRLPDPVDPTRVRGDRTHRADQRLQEHPSIPADERQVDDLGVSAQSRRLRIQVDGPGVGDGRPRPGDGARARVFFQVRPRSRPPARPSAVARVARPPHPGPQSRRRRRPPRVLDAPATPPPRPRPGGYHSRRETPPRVAPPSSPDARSWSMTPRLGIRGHPFSLAGTRSPLGWPWGDEGRPPVRGPASPLHLKRSRRTGRPAPRRRRRTAPMAANLRPTLSLSRRPASAISQHAGAGPRSSTPRRCCARRPYRGLAAPRRAR